MRKTGGSGHASGQTEGKGCPPEVCSLDFVRDIWQRFRLRECASYATIVMKRRSPPLIKINEEIATTVIRKGQPEVILADTEKQIFNCWKAALPAISCRFVRSR